VPSTVVLVPAHDEAEIIVSIVRNTSTALLDVARLLVSTDNCSNNSASRAEFAGADALERFELHLRGDGYAFAQGVNHST